MSLFVLDTDMLTLNQRGHNIVARHIAEHNPADLAICVISVEEQLSGWYAVVRQAKTKEKLARAYSQLARCVESLARITVLPFNEACIDRFEALRSTKIPVRTMDLRIAATVVEFGGTLVTRNSRDFEHVPGLTIADWSHGD